MELFTRDHRERVEGAFVRDHFIAFNMEDRPIRRVMEEVSPSGTKVYSLSELDGSGWAFFCESSVCFVLEEESELGGLNEAFVEGELSARSARHLEIIQGQTLEVIQECLRRISEVVGQSPLPIGINYVFGFTCIHRQSRIDDREKSLLKIISEPSILDVDDMISSHEYNRLPAVFPDPKHRLFSRIKDIDPSSLTTTYITWASIVSYSMDDKAYERTKHLLICLEVRLQATWNRCFSFSEYADLVFDGKTEVPRFDQMYWQFVRALDDAKSAISSTFSSRADIFFREMVKTSKLQGEIDRLQIKMNLVEKFQETQMARRNAIYQKTIEGLLFIAAIASVMQVVFPLPLPVDWRFGWATTAVIFVLGLLAILRIK